MRRNIFFSLLLLITVTVYFNTESDATGQDRTSFVSQPILIEKLPEKVVDTQQMNCLAINIYHEARGETVEGKFAVGHVTMNRVNSNRFPNSICKVVYQAELRTNWRGDKVPKRHRCQFSWYCDGKSDAIVLKTSEGKVIKYNMEAWEQSLSVASNILKYEIYDTTNGATHYFNDKLADPYWAKAFVQVASIENHVFHRMETSY